MLEDFRQLWRLQAGRDKRRLVLIALLACVAAVLEMTGIGLLLPIISLLQTPDLMLRSPRFNAFYVFVGSPEPGRFLGLLLLGLLAFYVAKNVFLVLLDRFQFRALSEIQFSISTRLMRAYLQQPYVFHVEHNSAQLVRNVTSEVSTIYYFAFVPMLSLLAETFVLVAMLALLVAVSPRASGALLLAGVAFGVVYYLVFRNKMYEIGGQIQSSAGGLVQTAQEGLGAIKEMKATRSESFFMDRFSRQAETNARGLRRAQVIHSFPLRLLEVIFVVAFIVPLVFAATKGGGQAIFPVLGLFAAAGFRLIPCFSRILTAAGRLRQGLPSVKLAIDTLAHSAPAARPMPDGHLPMSGSIQVCGVGFTYPGADTATLHDVWFEIQSGQMVGFVGKSGSGKTTLVDILLGILLPTEGVVRADGIDISRWPDEWARRVGYVPQASYLTDDTILKNVAFGTPDSEIDEEKVWRSLQNAQIADFIRNTPEGVHARLGERGVRLSGGQRQRIGIARALYREPEILVLDEATSALDRDTEKSLMGTINALKGARTIVIVTHRTETLDRCDRIFTVSEGRVSEAQI